MKRWNVAEMLEIGKKLFAKIHKRKYQAHHNHEIHWVTWWVNASETWQYNELLQWFLNYCWDINLASYAEALLMSYPVIKARSVGSSAAHDISPHVTLVA
jgi:hypothetical protein